MSDIDESDLEILREDCARKRAEVRRLQQLDDEERTRNHDEYSSDAQRGGATIMALLAAEEAWHVARWKLDDAVERAARETNDD